MIILDYLDGPNVITRVLIKEMEKSQNHRGDVIMEEEESEMVFSGLKSRCQQGCATSRGSEEKSISLSSPPSRDHLHSKATSLSSKPPMQHFQTSFSDLFFHYHISSLIPPNILFYENFVDKKTHSQKLTPRTTCDKQNSDTLPPKDVSILIHRTCGYVILHS